MKFKIDNQKNIINDLIVHITDGCTLSCRGCYLGKKKKITTISDQAIKSLYCIINNQIKINELTIMINPGLEKNGYLKLKEIINNIYKKVNNLNCQFSLRGIEDAIDSFPYIIALKNDYKSDITLSINVDITKSQKYYSDLIKKRKKFLEICDYITLYPSTFSFDKSLTQHFNIIIYIYNMLQQIINLKTDITLLMPKFENMNKNIIYNYHTLFNRLRKNDIKIFSDPCEYECQAGDWISISPQGEYSLCPIVNTIFKSTDFNIIFTDKIKIINALKNKCINCYRRTQCQLN